ncbi:unnamed protein product [Prunus armeniaca]|uniref:Uncharacterized protein n=1 Tax=Prunus armeniaca TaxID=36596 RepID=A0A6J5VLH6_PRUAR|nr:unnamed protein product [Prunus armeniaca]CAB4288724.1 unnamed protein product [Prunus armeniaca]
MPSLNPDPCLPLLLRVSPLFFGAASQSVVLILARSPTFGPLLISGFDMALPASAMLAGPAIAAAAKCFDVGGEIKNLKGAEKILSEMVRVVELKLKKQLKRAAKSIVGGLSNENSSITASKILEKMHVA